MGETHRRPRAGLLLVLVLALLAASCGRSDGGGGGGGAAAVGGGADCKGVTLRASDTGVTAGTITIEVMADTGSPLAPGIFQGDVDAVTGYAKYANANGGVGCRKLVVRTWDSKFTPAEAKNGQLDACKNALAMVGGNSVFNPDPTAMEGCGLPDVAAFAVDTNEMCSKVTVGVNTRAEACPIVPNTERDITRIVGPMRRMAEQNPGLRGVYLGNGDLPSTKLSAIPDIAVQEKVGIRFDAKLLNHATEEQSAYTPRVGFLKTGSDYVYGGTSDMALVAFMKEAKAQGVDTTKVVWLCGVACYTQRFLSAGGSAVEGAYVWIPFIPLEEAGTVPALKAYVDTIGRTKVDTWGVVSWQAALAFRQVVDRIVKDEGPNAITRAKLLAGLRQLKGFDADGISGPRALGGTSNCYVLMQVEGGKFVRSWPKKPGTFDCDKSNVLTVRVNPEKASATDLTG